MSERPWYVIMDERAVLDVDRAMVLSADGAMPALRQVQQERNRHWPGCPIVDITTNTVVDAGREGEG